VTSGEIARSHLRQARLILEEAKRYRRNGVWHLAVRRSQESVELALKGLLRAAGLEVPQVHDVSAFLVEHGERLPAALRPDLDRLVSVSRRLRREREVSFYGDEETGAAPDRLYTARDAEQAVGDARDVVALCERYGPAP
jgi:HEPN domain-containing protein